jgi:hypothetical protein
MLSFAALDFIDTFVLVGLIQLVVGKVTSEIIYGDGHRKN